MSHKSSTAVKNVPSRLHHEVRNLIENKEYAAARDALLQSLKTNKTAEAYCDLGNVMAGMGNKNEAVINFENAIKIDPKCHQAYASIADLLVTEGHIFHALEYYRLAIVAAPAEKKYATNFLMLANVLHVKAFNKDLKELLTGILQRDEVGMTSSTRVWYHLLRLDPSFKDIFKALKKNDAAAYGNFKKALIKNKKSVLDPYFLLGTKSYIIPAQDFENFVTNLRRFLLEELQTEKPVYTREEFLRVACALAGNCLLTEYIQKTSEDESRQADALRKEIESGHDGDEARLALLACYSRIDTLKNAEEISAALAKSALPEMRELGRIHIDDKRAQQEIRKTITAITKITDAVSKSVQEQYEAFPYPQWKDYPVVWADEKVEGRFTSGERKILNAGCGTGQEAIGLAATFPQAKVLAVDLSLSSLSYAAKRARDFGINNIDFRQGDILALGALEERFDYIASGGVLHHMKDPAAGLAVLARLLKPDGIIRLGLYSETARRHIVKTREVIAGKGFGNDAASIHRFRHEAPALLEKETYENLCGLRDYYSLSECRDLLFHVQEHRFTIPQLKKFLSGQGLEFISFRMRPDILLKYKTAYPQDEEMNSLDNWHEFEQKNPDTFIEMYRFWCRKR